MKNEAKNTGILIILTGPTASGKTEIRDLLIRKYKKLKGLVTTTSRKMRGSEKNGIDYHFVSTENFAKKVEKGDFLEFTEYAGNLYGTTKNELERMLSGEYLISTMEISGAAKFAGKIKDEYDEKTAIIILERALIVFVHVENDEVLKRRYELRKSSLGDFETRRLQDKNMEKEYMHLFKNKIINDDEKIREAISEVEQLMQTNLGISLTELN